MCEFIFFKELNTAAHQQEIEHLNLAAKNSKLSATEARQKKADCAQLREEILTISEQRTEVAGLFEKRELQLANVKAQVFVVFCLT